MLMRVSPDAKHSHPRIGVMIPKFRNSSLAMHRRAIFLVAAAALSTQTPSANSQQTGASRPASTAISAATGSPTSSAAVEDWDDLSLHGKSLASEPVIVGQIDTTPEFVRELVRVQWRGGDPIDLYIIRPPGVAKPHVIVYLYGYPGEAVRFLNSGLCKTVTAGGYAAVGFSSMLTGQRYHNVPMKDWFVSELPRTLVGTTHDVQMVLNYLAQRGDFDLSRVGIFGEGSGGTIGLLEASVDPRIGAVDVLDPWGDWPTWLASSHLVPESERPQYLAPAFLKSIAPFDPVSVLPKLTNLSLRLQQDLWEDDMTPPLSARRIAAALPAGADLSRYKDRQEYLDKVGSNGKMLDWMYAHLNASTVPKTAP
jgi:hypothetical protein